MLTYMNRHIYTCSYMCKIRNKLLAWYLKRNETTLANFAVECRVGLWAMKKIANLDNSINYAKVFLVAQKMGVSTDDLMDCRG